MAMFYKLFIIRLNCWPKDTTLQFTCRRMNWGTSQPRQAVVSSAKPLVGISVWRHSHPAAPIPLMPTMQFCKAVQRHISGHCSGCRRKRKILLLSGVFLTVDRFPVRLMSCNHCSSTWRGSPTAGLRQWEGNH